MTGSADGLRAVSERITGDFICIISDVISQYPLGELAYLHRMQTSDLTMMFTVASKDKKENSDPVDQEYIGISEDGRVVIKTSTLEIEDMITISKPLLHRCSSNLTLRNDLIDLGIYIMSYWVIEFLNSNKRISSLKSDLIPYLIKRQFQPYDYLLSVIPALEHRSRPLKTIESWLVETNQSLPSLNKKNNSNSNNNVTTTIYEDEDSLEFKLDLISHVCANNNNNNKNQFLSSSSTTAATISNINSVNKSTINVINNNNDNINISNNNKNNKNTKNDTSKYNHMLTNNNDVLRCFALVYDTSASSVLSSTGSTPILSRITNIQAYLNINRWSIIIIFIFLFFFYFFFKKKKVLF
jgi:hypothetical protein